MKYICDSVANNKLKKDDLKINKLEVNIDDNLYKVYKDEKLALLFYVFSLIFMVVVNIAMSFDSENNLLIMWSSIGFISLALFFMGFVIEYKTYERLDEMDTLNDNYYFNRRKDKVINELLDFLSNKDKYSNISYNPRTRIITYFNENGLLQKFDAIDKINNCYGDDENAYTEYWMNDYIKIDIDNNKIIKYYPFNLKEV